MKKAFLYNLKQVLIIFCASIATAIAVEVFLLPSNAIVGGVLGVSSTLEILLTKFVAYKWYFSAGIWLVAINVPIIIYCFFRYRKRFVIKTMLYVLLLAMELVVLRVFNVAQLVRDNGILATEEGVYDNVISVLLGGALHGLSLPLLLSVNASAGGTDVVGLVVQRHSKKSSSDAMRFILAANVIVIFFASIAYWIVNRKAADAVNMFIYSLSAVFVGEIVQEAIFKGFSAALELEITTDKPTEMAEALADGLKHSTTTVKVVGGYSHQEKTMILCVINRSQLVKARRIINKVDANAFAYVENVKEVIGKGFANKENELEGDDK